MLLKEIMAFCESFRYAQAVSLESGKVNSNLELRVFWAPDKSETKWLQKIVAKHGVEMATVNERLVFRSKIS